MTVRAYVQDDLMCRGVSIVLEQEYNGGGRMLYGPGSDKQWLETPGTTPPDDAVEPLRLTDRDARALLDGLARHYGAEPDDARALRKDYDHERARVDRLMDVMTRVALGYAPDPPVTERRP